MIGKIKDKLAEFLRAEKKIAWLREDWKWRYFRHRQKKHISQNMLFDRHHNVETATEIALDQVGIPTDEASRGNGVYRCLTEQLFWKAMAALKVDPSCFTFVDVGSGKGKVMFMAADLPFKRIVGIEYARDLHDVAVRNVASFRSETQRCHDIEPVHMDALQYPLPPGPVVVFLFNSLAKDVMAAFVTNIDIGAGAEPDRPVLLIYTNLRSVRELGDPFSDRQNLQVIQRARNFVLVANDAGSLVRTTAT